VFDHLFFGDYFKNKQKQINLGELTLKHKVLVGKKHIHLGFGWETLENFPTWAAVAVSPPAPPRAPSTAPTTPTTPTAPAPRAASPATARPRRPRRTCACGCRPVPAGWNTKGELSNLSMDWIKGKSTGNHGFNHQI